VDPARSSDRPVGDLARPAGAPTELGRFILLSQVGAGGMGVVYAAYDPELDRKVAVKLLHPNLTGSDREDVGRTRLLREAQALARLSHPNVVAVYDVGTWGRQVFVAMEFVQGVPLTAWLRERPRTRAEVLAVMRDAGRGLAAAHRAGLVHGDFKPDNVLVDRGGRVRVVDFGLSFAQDRGAGEQDPITPVDVPPDLHRTGALVGTPAYLSPEQFFGAPGSARADQFSFCVSLHEALYGERPYPGDDLRELARAVALGPVPPEAPGRRLPTWLRRVLLRGLHRDPAQRFPDMDALLAALARDPTRRRRRLAAAAAAVLVLVLAAWAYRWSLLRAYAAREGLCAAAADNLAGVWDEGRRASLRAALRATGVPYADDTFSRVAARLDAHTDAWVQMYAEACQATHLRGEQSPALLDLRMACLRRRLGEVRSLVDVLLEADAAAAERAAQAAALLPALAPCADAAALLDDPDADPAHAAVAAAFAEQLSRVRMLQETARFAPARELVDAALARARETGDRALIAEVTLARAELLEELADPGAAEALLDAFHTAEGSRADVALARAALGLMHAATSRLDLAGARQWARHARALVDRVAAQRPEAASPLESELAQISGTLHVHAGELAGAEEDYGRALALLLAAPEPDELRIAGVHNNLGNLRVRRGELARAADDLHRAVAGYRAVLGDRHPRVAIALNNLGEVWMRRGEWSEARATYNQAREILVSAFGPDHPNVGVVDNNLGEVAIHSEQPAAAAALYARAQRIFTASFGEDAAPLAYPLTGLGEALLLEGRVAEARAHLEKALALRDAGSPADLGRTRFALARAVAPDDPARADELAAMARAELVAAGPAYARELSELDLWLADRPARDPR
jgi:predicted Ser/Thr protein kinase